MLPEVKENIDNMIATMLAKVSIWKYATGIYFPQLPFDNEMNRFTYGELLENVVESERFNQRDIHSFGFDEFGDLIIMQVPNADNDLKFGVSTTLYTVNPDKSVHIYISTWFPKNNNYTDLIAIKLFAPINKNNWVSVGVNSNKRNWVAKHYIYSASVLGKIEKVISYVYPALAPLPPSSGIEVFDFIYDDFDNLKEISIDGSTYWNKTNNSKP